MIDSGFEIGLHFDPTIYNNIELGFKKEVEIFEKVFDTEIKSVSLHNPSIHGSYPLFDGYINAYSPELFEESRYLSDSLRNFRGKDPFEFIKNIKDKPMQIVLHPIYYGV
jgi:hypothetical protein